MKEEFHAWSKSENTVTRHAGVLALAAIVQAFPYSVPSFLPGVLMLLCPHATDDQPIKVSKLLKINLLHSLLTQSV